MSQYFADLEPGVHRLVGFQYFLQFFLLHRDLLDNFMNLCNDGSKQ
jgi:hypothetical protein